MARARFLLKPRWLLSHLLVALLVVVMVNLGFWQLRRLDEKRDHKAFVEQQIAHPPTPVGDLLDPGDGEAAVEAVRFRGVSATGRYDADGTIEVRNRSLDGSPGVWLVTPLVLDGDAGAGAGDGERVAVIRGFVGFSPDGSIAHPPPPEGEVELMGLLMDPHRLGGTAGRDLDPLLAGEGMLPAVVQAQASEPDEPQGADPASAGIPGTTSSTPGVIVLLPPPELSEGPHLSYAIQWFIFSAIAVVGYPLILRRVVLRRGKEVDDRVGDGEPAAPGRDDVDRELEDLLRQGE